MGQDCVESRQSHQFQSNKLIPANSDVLALVCRSPPIWKFPSLWPVVCASCCCLVFVIEAASKLPESDSFPLWQSPKSSSWGLSATEKGWKPDLVSLIVRFLTGEYQDFRRRHEHIRSFPTTSDDVRRCPNNSKVLKKMIQCSAFKSSVIP